MWLRTSSPHPPQKETAHGSPCATKSSTLAPSSSTATSRLTCPAVWPWSCSTALTHGLRSPRMPACLPPLPRCRRRSGCDPDFIDAYPRPGRTRSVAVRCPGLACICFYSSSWPIGELSFLLWHYLLGFLKSCMSAGTNWGA